MFQRHSFSSKFLVLSAPVLAIGLIYVLVVTPILSARQDQHWDVVRKQAEIAALRNERTEIAQKRRELAQLEPDVRKSGFFQRHASVAASEASVRAKVSSTIKESGGLAISIQSLPRSKIEGFQALTVRSQMTASVGAMQKIFYAIEAAKPALFLAHVTIRKTNTRGHRSANKDNTKTSGETMLDIRFDVRAYAEATQ